MQCSSAKDSPHRQNDPAIIKLNVISNYELITSVQQPLFQFLMNDVRTLIINLRQAYKHTNAFNGDVVLLSGTTGGIM